MEQGTGSKEVVGSLSMKTLLPTLRGEEEGNESWDLCRNYRVRPALFINATRGRIGDSEKVITNAMICPPFVW
jgi:hypothetical protein